MDNLLKINKRVVRNKHVVRFFYNIFKGTLYQDQRLLLNPLKSKSFSELEILYIYVFCTKILSELILDNFFSEINKLVGHVGWKKLLNK